MLGFLAVKILLPDSRFFVKRDPGKSSLVSDRVYLHDVPKTDIQDNLVAVLAIEMVQVILQFLNSFMCHPSGILMVTTSMFVKERVRMDCGTLE